MASLWFNILITFEYEYLMQSVINAFKHLSVFVCL